MRRRSIPLWLFLFLCVLTIAAVVVHAASPATPLEAAKAAKADADATLAAAQKADASAAATVAAIEASEHPKEEPPPKEGYVVALDAGGWGSIEPGDFVNAVDYVRLSDEHSTASEFAKYETAGISVIRLRHGPYTPHEGVKAINVSQWASEAVSEYQAHPYWALEILNEPGGDWFWGAGAQSAVNEEAYARLCKAVHEAFAGLAKRPLLLASYDGGHLGEVFWGEGVWKADSHMNEYVDGITMHPYGGHGANSATGSRFNVERAHSKTGLPVYVTEIGWPTLKETGDSKLWTEAQQAENITGFIRWSEATGYVKAVSVYGHRDGSGSAGYGIFRSDGSRKPAVAALEALDKP